MKKILIFFTFLLLFFPFAIKAKSLDVVINEIAWAGTLNSANDEWIELFNNTSNEISLEGWTLNAADGAPEIKLSGAIPSNGFYILERTDDNTLPDITAGLIYKGSMENIGEDLKLYDSSNNLIDEVNCDSGWFSGDSGKKQTMERIDASISGSDSDNWQTSQDSNGTPKSKGGTVIIQNTETKTETKTYPGGIIFSEILPSPEGADSENEWMEIYNGNDLEVDLSNWKIKDATGKVTAYTFPNEMKIAPLGYLILKRPETQITLNNDADSLTLFDPNGKTTDSITYEKAPNGKSYVRIGNDWVWTTELTPGSKNAIKTAATTSKTKTKLASVSENIVGLTNNQTIDTATEIPKEKSSFPILIAIGLAVFSGIAIYVIKKNI